MRKRLFTILIATILSLFLAGTAFISVSTAGQGNFVTGGGWITKNDANVNFGFNVKYLKNGTLQGEFTMVDRSTGVPVQYKSISLRKLYIRDASFAGFIGQAKIDGEGSYTFWVHVIDNGTPGTNDAIEIIVSNGYFARAQLDGGNIDIKY